MIHRALSSIPARPALIIAPVVAMAVLGFYFWNLNLDCTRQAGFRVSFLQQVEGARISGEYLVLSEITDFTWDHVKGFEDFRPQHRKTSCPFGWDWSDSERKSIIDAGLMSVLLYFHEGAIARYVEFRNDRVSIEEFEKGLTPETAAFRVADGASTGSFRLHVQSSK